MAEAVHLSPRAVRATFEAAAAGYDAAAHLQREVAARLIERLPLFRLQPQRILDLGCGTGHATAMLATHHPAAQVVGVDLALGMARQTHTRLPRWQRWRRGHAAVSADAAMLPFQPEQFDLIFSNLTLQWCGDLPALFAGLQRVLRPGGLLLFSTLGPETLQELRQSWAEVDDRVHVNRFVDLHDVGDALLQGGLADAVMDMEHITVTYQRVETLMRDLKQIGAHNIDQQRHRGLTGAGRMRAMTAAYEQFRGADGLLPATYEVLYGHAWCATAETRPGGGEATVPLQMLTGQQGGRS